MTFSIRIWRARYRGQRWENLDRAKNQSNCRIRYCTLLKKKGIFSDEYQKIVVVLLLFSIFFIHRLRQNYELLKHRKQEAKGTLITLEKEIANMTEKTRVLNKRMNSIKPEIIKLQRSKQQYYL